MKRRRKIIYLSIMGSVLLLVYILLDIYKFQPSPRILDVQLIETVTEEDAVGDSIINVVKLIGENFFDNFNVYIEGNKVDSINRIDEQTILFNLPEIYSSQGDKKIQVINKSDSIFKKKSNIVTLYIEPKSKIITKQPVINNVKINSISSLVEILQIEGENFTQSSTVFINDIKQEGIVIYDDKNISLKIMTPEWGLTDEFAFTVMEGEAKSNAYSIVNSKQYNLLKSQFNNIDYLKQGFLVAHAFGALDEQTYTNSREAFLSNYEAGHRLFEVDFQLTSDDVLVTLHDRTGRIFTLEEESHDLPYTIMSFQDVCELMLEYEDFYIITDTKYTTNFNAIKSTFDYMINIISKIDAKLIDRIIVQVYNQKMYYFMINNYNFKSYIYTLYASTDSNEQVIEFVKETGISAVTMWASRATTDFITALNEIGVYTFTHTVNDLSEIASLLNIGVFGIYTDFIKYDDLQINRNERFLSFKNGVGNNEVDLNKQIFKTYMNSINNPEYTYIISITGSNGIVITEDMLNSFNELGLKVPNCISPNEKYLAIISKKDNVFEEISLRDITYSWNSDDVYSNVIFNNEMMQVFVNGIDYNTSHQGIQIVTYDTVNDLYISTVCFNPDENLKKYNFNVNVLNSRRYFLDYLDEINKEKYIILMSVRDEGSSAIDETIQKKLHDIGLCIPIKDKYRCAYAAILNNNEVIYEDSADDTVSKFMIIDEWLINIVSSSYNGENYSSISIDGKEFSINKRGINIVLFDKTLGAVVESVCFDTYDQIQCYRN